MVEVIGTLEIAVKDFVYLQGDFAVRSSTQTIVLNDEDGTEVDVDALNIGANGVDLFAGVNRGEANEIGLNLTDGALALALFSERAVSERKWTALQAGIGSVELVGVDDVTVSGTNLAAEANLAADDGTVVDFAAMAGFGNTYTVSTGPDTSVDFNLDGDENELIQVTGTLEIAVKGYAYIQGDFAVRSATTTVTLNDDDATEVEVDALNIGATGVDLFAGVNRGESNEIGVSLTDGALALALLSERAGSGRKWSAFQASLASVELVGVDEVSISGTNLAAEANLAADDGTVVDFAAMAEAGSTYTILTGPDTSVDMGIDGEEGELVQVTGTLEIAVKDFLYL